MLEVLNKAVPFNAHLGIEVLGLEQTGATSLLPDDPRLKNHVGTQHAGALFAAAECASGAAVFAAFREIVMVAPPLLRGADIKYRRAGIGPIRAVARLSDAPTEGAALFHRDGRLDIQVTVALMDSEGTEVATGSFDWCFRAPRSKAPDSAAQAA